MELPGKLRYDVKTGKLVEVPEAAQAGKPK
jgi:hypothetical protein